MGIRLGTGFLLLLAMMGLAQSSQPAGVVTDQPEYCGSARPGEAGYHLRVSSGTMAGQLVSRPNPIFPREAWTQHVSGVPVLRVCIGKDGHVEKMRVISGPEMLRQAWVDAVSRWVYRPYLLNGTAVPVETTVTINYQMGALPTDQGCGSARPYDPDFHVRVSSGTMAGQLISRPDPVVPPLPAGSHVSSGTVMKVCISRQGRVETMQAISGPEVLRKPVADTISRWVYRPYLVDGKPPPVVTTVTVYMSFGGGE